MNQPEEPASCSCRLLSRGKHCPTFTYFNKDVPKYSVYDVSRMQGKKLAELVDNEIFNTTDIPDDFPLSPNQIVQVSVDKSGKPIINREKIQARTIPARISFIFHRLRERKPSNTDDR